MRDDLVDRFDHVHGDPDRARLIGDRTRDRLPDPPRRISRELVAAAILELIDRLHQADVAFLNEIEELQTAVRVFLCDRDDEPKVGFDHFLLRLPCLALAFLHGFDDAPVFRNFEARLGRELMDLGANLLDLTAFDS